MKNTLLLIALLTSMNLYAQTLYVPSGTGGIGSSGNSNVGIGTSSPGAKLHIANSGGGQGLWIQASDPAKYLSLWQGNSGAVIEPIGTSDFYVGYTALTNVYLASSGGKVAIGLTSPDYLFQVNSSNPAIAIGKSNANTNGKSTLAFFAGNGSAANGFFVNYMKTASVDRLAFVDGGSIECMSILNGGNIGIGTTAPGSYKLAVEGKVGAREVNVTMAAWSDYVFADDYKLPSLRSVEEYIKQNRHLPEIPSEKEVVENGVDLGAMNALLVKKIEELTLHIIEQEKRIEKLETQKK